MKEVSRGQAQRYHTGGGQTNHAHRNTSVTATPSPPASQPSAFRTGPGGTERFFVSVVKTTTPLIPQENHVPRRHSGNAGGTGQLVSRVLFPLTGMVIHLGWPSPATSSSLPAALLRRSEVWCGSHLAAYLALLRLGVAVPPCLRSGRWALTPPFHPYRDGSRHPRRFVFCGPVRRLSAPRRYLAVYPVELGLSSRGASSSRDHRSRPVQKSSTRERLWVEARFGATGLGLSSRSRV